jgi:hypothetical protein
MKRISALAWVLALGACTSTPERGWTGTDAAPFDGAQARCQIETQTVDGPDFERCMANLGWRRTP